MAMLRRPTSWLLTVMIVIMVGFLGIGAFQVLSGSYKISPVTSGSMRPGFSVGGVVVSKRIPTSDLELRDVAVLQEPTNPSQQYVHRIIKIKHTPQGARYSTKGDNNPVADPWDPFGIKADHVYVVQFSVPLIGYVALWLHQPGVRTWAIMIAGILLLAYVVYEVLPARAKARLRPSRGRAQPDA